MDNRELAQMFANVMGQEYANQFVNPEQVKNMVIDCLVSVLALSLTNPEQAKETLKKIVLKS